MVRHWLRCPVRQSSIERADGKTTVTEIAGGILDLAAASSKAAEARMAAINRREEYEPGSAGCGMDFRNEPLERKVNSLVRNSSFAARRGLTTPLRCL